MLGIDHARAYYARIGRLIQGFKLEDGVVVEMSEQEKSEQLEKSPCAGCGDKTNIAQVMASPAAIEALLRGE